MPATKIVVNIPDEAPYDVRIGEGILGSLGEKLGGVPALSKAKRLLVITDDTVAPLYLGQAKEALAAFGVPVADISVPAGEDAKSLAVAGELWEAMAMLGLGRDSAVVALGGGVVGDLAGFVGSTFMRGLPVVQVPTTLLSMVDSSVGGKTAVNLSSGKNLVGTFWQPAYVCADTAVLATLPEREWACGCAEVAKSAVIDSDDFFFWLLGNADAMAQRDPAVVQQAIARCVVLKADVVSRDKAESCGVRECLNYGHTLAHAIEKLSGYGTFSHGAAVAEGMRFAARMAEVLLGTSSEFVETQGQLLDALGLPPLTWRAPASDMLAAMKHDKKTRGGAIRFVLPCDVGDWVVQPVEDAVVLEALEEWEAAV